MSFYILCRRFPGYHPDFPFFSFVAWVHTERLLEAAVGFVHRLQSRAHEIEGADVPFQQAWTQAVAEWADLKDTREEHGRRPRIFPHPQDWPGNDGEPHLPQPGPLFAVFRVEDEPVARRIVDMLDRAFQDIEQNPRFAYFDGRRAPAALRDLWDVTIAQTAAGRPAGDEPEATICRTGWELSMAASSAWKQSESHQATELPQANAGGGAEAAPMQRAIAIAIAHPEYTNKTIAEKVGVNRTTLNDWPTFMALRSAQRASGKRGIPRGSKDRDGTIEAEAE